MEQKPIPGEVQFDPEGSITRPRMIGRLVRLFIGIYLVLHARQVFALTDVRAVDNPMMWVSLVLALWFLPTVVNIGFGVDWKRYQQWLLIVLGVVAAAAGLGLYGSPFSVPLWWWMKATTVYTWTHLGVSFVLSAMLATPGCEMRSIPDLIARLRRRPTQEHFCPGFIRRLDEWEARVFNRPGQFGPGGVDQDDS